MCLYNQTRYPDAKYKPSERRGEIAKLLIDHETDIKKIDKVRSKINEGIYYCVRHKLNQQDGRTPLIAASDSGFADIVELLVHKISEFPADERQKYLDHKKHVW